MTNQILDALDPEQRTVATLLDSPVVVLAGAGTGKTRAITHRIAHAVSEGRYSPTATLAVTFTTRAAGEMRARLAGLGVRGAQARTIHSAALRQCQFFWPKAYGVAFPTVAENTFGLVARATHQVLGTSDTALVRDLSAEIGWAKTSNVAPAQYADVAGNRAVNGATTAQIANVMTLYEKAKLTEGTVDFNDILLCNAVLLSEHEEIAETIRATYRHFVVDEYQDVSALQHRLINLWVDGRADVCVVGDANQAIHSFAGADAGYLLGFAAEYPGAQTVRLVRNYRSTPEVIDSANRVLRARGAAAALKATKPKGPAPSFHSAADEASEAADVARWLKQQREAGTRWSELAVLYRINAQAPALEAALTEKGVPYTVRGTERFYDRAEVRQAIIELDRRVQREPEAVPSEALLAVMTGLGWKPEAPSGQGRQRERWESLTALRSMVADEGTQRGEWSGTDAVAWLQERASWQSAPVADAVTLSTLHAAKGLEWDGVAIVGVREGLIPFVLAQEEPALAEERRLLYVGFTRAKHRLRVSWSASRGKGTRSRFIADQVGGETEVVATPRRATSVRSRTCRVCGNPLGSAAERKLNRHEGCEVSYDEALFEALRAWRKGVAEDTRMPAFVIFTDATLQAIAEAVPTTAADLLKLPGIGQSKLAKYGDGALNVIRQHQDS